MLAPVRLALSVGAASVRMTSSPLPRALSASPGAVRAWAGPSPPSGYILGYFLVATVCLAAQRGAVPSTHVAVPRPMSLFIIFQPG